MLGAWQGTFFEAFCQEIDPAKKEIIACAPPGADMDEACFKIPYDILLLGAFLFLHVQQQQHPAACRCLYMSAGCAAVGSVNNTFGIKGVEEHTFFFKNIEDANRLRRRVSECFERASLPQTTEEVAPC